MEQVGNLRLDGRVEGTGRLVADQEVRLHGHRPGDRHPLQFPAAQLPRIAVPGGTRQADLFQQPDYLGLHLPPGAEPVADERFPQKRPHLHPRADGTGGALEDHLHLTAHHFPVPAGKGRQFPAVKPDAPLPAPQDPGGQPGEGRLAAPRLADDGNRLARPHREAEIPEGGHFPLPRRVGIAEGEVFKGQNRLHLTSPPSRCPTVSGYNPPAGDG